MGMKFDDGEEEYHSNYIIYGREGKVIRSAKGRACYSEVWGGYAGMEALELWFPEHDLADKYVRDLVNWILNSDTFGVVFLTKDYDEGVKNGFKVDIHKPTNLIFMNMAALRFPWEAGQSGEYDWYYPRFIDDGFNIEQAFYLAVNFDIYGKGIREAGYNTNHTPFPHGLEWDKLNLKHFKCQEGTMYGMNSSTGVSGRWDRGQFGFNSDKLIQDLIEEGFQEVSGEYTYYTVVEYTPKLIEHLKNKLKR